MSPRGLAPWRTSRMERPMRTFDIQSLAIDSPAGKVFDYVADPAHLPEWTGAFKAIEGRRAVLSTPDGTILIDFDVRASHAHGTIDWEMTFPDGSVAKAYSRVVETVDGRAIYSFVLLPPPVPLEKIEGALEQQSRILEEELGRLKRILESEGARSTAVRPVAENG